MLVYWLYDISCSWPQSEGYVGVTNNLRRRLREHRRRRKGFDVAVLFAGSDIECFTVERELRPRPSIGWNNGAGGPDGRKSGHSEETRKKIGVGALGRQHMRGKKLTLEHRANISAGNKGRKTSNETRAKLRASWAGGQRIPGMSGRKHSEETKARMREAQLQAYANGKVRKGNGGHRHTEETKAKIREARLRQPDPRLGWRKKLQQIGE
jgi:hypothetical protein